MRMKSSLGGERCFISFLINIAQPLSRIETETLGGGYGDFFLRVRAATRGFTIIVFEEYLF